MKFLVPVNFLKYAFIVVIYQQSVYVLHCPFLISLYFRFYLIFTLLCLVSDETDNKRGRIVLHVKVSLFLICLQHAYLFLSVCCS